jgi:hypothetical protein
MDNFEMLADLADFFGSDGILPNKEEPLPISNGGRVIKWYRVLRLI